MGKVGQRPVGGIKIEWTPDFAYMIGILATDGCLYSDGLHINLTSKDREQIVNFKKVFGLKNKIGKKARSLGAEKKYFVIQFGDVIFYKFLLSIGLTPAKSKTLGAIAVPEKYFPDFLRGVFDGDGYSYSYWDKRWKSSFMYYVGFVSASPRFILWLKNIIHSLCGISGHISADGRRRSQQLKYAKHESMRLVRKMYYSPRVICLSRKRLKLERTLAIVGEKL